MNEDKPRAWKGRLHECECQNVPRVLQQHRLVLAGQPDSAAQVDQRRQGGGPQARPRSPVDDETVFLRKIGRDAHAVDAAVRQPQSRKFPREVAPRVLLSPCFEVADDVRVPNDVIGGHDVERARSRECLIEDRGAGSMVTDDEDGIELHDSPLRHVAAATVPASMQAPHDPRVRATSVRRQAGASLRLRLECRTPGR